MQARQHTHCGSFAFALQRSERFQAIRNCRNRFSLSRCSAVAWSNRQQVKLRKEKVFQSMYTFKGISSCKSCFEDLRCKWYGNIDIKMPLEMISKSLSGPFSKALSNRAIWVKGPRFSLRSQERERVAAPPALYRWYYLLAVVRTCVF